MLIRSPLGTCRVGDASRLVQHSALCNLRYVHRILKYCERVQVVRSMAVGKQIEQIEKYQNVLAQFEVESLTQLF